MAVLHALTFVAPLIHLGGERLNLRPRSRAPESATATSIAG
jgi:hypothetical protein